MIESAATPGLYTVEAGPLQPSHGWTTVVMQITCPDGDTVFDSFNLYIDPSGHVNNQNGNRIEGAVVSLYRAEQPEGPFELVPDGSAIMSPTNRKNPMLSDDRGHFGWDTIAGYYVVRAEKPGCTAVLDAAQPYAETDVLPVPPPVTDLDLRLDCSAVPPPSIAAPSSVSAEAQSLAGAVVDYDASALDPADGPVPMTCLPASGSLFPFGTTIVTCSAMNSSGNVGTASFPVTVADTTAPALGLPGDIEAYATGAAGASVSFAATAQDSIDGALAASCLPPSGTTFPLAKRRCRGPGHRRERKHRDGDIRRTRDIRMGRYPAAALGQRSEHAREKPHRPGTIRARWGERGGSRRLPRSSSWRRS